MCLLLPTRSGAIIWLSCLWQTIEVYIHRTGFNAHEAVATHSRRRYRFVKSEIATSNQPPVDPSLWIVHYTRADPQNLFPANRIPLRPETRVTLNQRNFLKERGQLVRKEFMLGDRNSWPTIKSLHPRKKPRSTQHMSSYPGNVIQHMNRTQQQAQLQSQYSSRPGMGPSVAKRPRQLGPNPRPGTSTSIAAMAIAQDSSLDEDEDTLKGDLMDALTPRDISAMRYMQHHEWMEEVFSSPFATGQIVPVELGLGRKGELESLTRDFFDAPTDKTPITADEDNSAEAVNPRFKGIESTKVDDFMRRALEKIAELNLEMENMKKKHANEMAKVGQGQVVRGAEKRLRSLVALPSTEGSVWEGNKQTPGSANSDLAAAVLRQQDQVDSITREVENALGRKVEVIHSFKCVQKGGLEEKARPEEILQIDDPAAISNDQPMVDTDMTSFPEFDDKTDWMQEDIISEPTPAVGTQEAAPQPETTNPEMPDHAPDPEPANQSDPGDWVMVDPPATDLPAPASADADPTATTTAAIPAAPILPSELPDFGTDVPELQGEGFDGGDFDQSVDFATLDSAGDALAGFDAPPDALGDEGDMGLVLEESAFGDAFHHAEVEAEAQIGADVDMAVGSEVEPAGDAAASAGAAQGESA